MRFLIMVMLSLSACAIPCPQERVICDPATRTCICERPTGTLAAVDRADCMDGATWRDACSRDRAAVERPEPEEPGGHWATRDNEPDSRTDPEGHRDWQRDRDAQREEGTW